MERMKLIHRIFSLAILLSLSACSGGLFNQASPTPPDTATPSPIPTSTPTPAPTPTPTPLPAARLEKGYTAYLNGEYDLAVREYQNALDASQDADIQANARVKMARIKYLQGDSTGALNLFRQAADSSAGADARSEAWYYLAQIYTGLTRYEDAIAAYETYLEVKPGSLTAYINEKLGDANAAAGQYQDAVAAYYTASQQPDANVIALKMKIAQNTSTLGDAAVALSLYQEVYNLAVDEYTRAQADLLMGQIYIQMGDTQSGYDRYLDAVTNYPRAYDSYSALSALVNDNVEVSYLNRGMVDYYAGQYNIAADVLNTYIRTSEVHNDTAHYFRALALTQLGEYGGAIEEWDAIIQDHPNDRFWSSAWDEKAYTQWYYLGRYEDAAATLLTFIAAAPQDSLAASMLFETGRIYERNDQLDAAVAAWERLPAEYPDADYAYMGIHFAGITRYRQGRYAEALPYFQRALLLGTDSTEKASAYFWMGKSAEANNDHDSAITYWQYAMDQDPTGYYSIRARDLSTGREAYQACKVLDLGLDLNSEIPGAEAWMIQKFALPADTNLKDNSAIFADARIWRAQEYWRLGLFEKARNEVSGYREENKANAVIQYQLGQWLVNLGMYREAILATRQVLTLAGLDDNGTLTAPLYFNHVRFGPYYRELITKEADENDLDPLLIYSVIRQESMFEPFISSYAGAEGLMQMLPSTAREVTSQTGWPPVFLDDDIFRPEVSIGLGSYYLNQQIRLLGGNIHAGLAAYNGGPGNASAWLERSNGDPDLYLEVVRFQETRSYLRAILEIFNLYKTFYCR